MAQQPRHLRSPYRRAGHPGRRKWLRLLGAVVFASLVALFTWRMSERRASDASPAMLSAAPSALLSDALAPDAIEFAPSIVRAVQQRGLITVTVHVALADHRSSEVPAKFGDGDNPTANMYWGALYGVETYLANAGGWRRAYTDDGDGARIIRRVVFHRKAEVTSAWRSRGITRPFDIYVLANAWPNSQIIAAMEQPLRDALCDDIVTLTIDGFDLAFGAGSVITGYVGPNRMIGQYWDPFSRLEVRARERQTGVFYVCSMSAVYLHQPVVDHGLYSVLFTRRAIVPEAYIIDGLLNALLIGDLDEGFRTTAAEQYARYQKDVSLDEAMFLFYR